MDGTRNSRRAREASMRLLTRYIMRKPLDTLNWPWISVIVGSEPAKNNRQSPLRPVSFPCNISCPRAGETINTSRLILWPQIRNGRALYRPISLQIRGKNATDPRRPAIKLQRRPPSRCRQESKVHSAAAHPGYPRQCFRSSPVDG